MTNPLTALRSRVAIYALGAYKLFIENFVVENQKELFRLEIDRPSDFFNSRKRLEGLKFF
jgi:hypothetical protein